MTRKTRDETGSFDPGGGGFVDLPGRGVVVVAGADRARFLQNLVTHDVRLLETQPVVYAALLTPQGKFLHDFFMTTDEDSILLETQGGARAEDLARRLNLYRLRADVTVTARPHVRVGACLVWPPEGLGPEGFSAPAGQGRAYPDPRHPRMGGRILRSGQSPPDALGASHQGLETFERRRISLRIPDGFRDLIPEEDNIIETGLDRLNGVSFTKGCYVGQEVTARLHHRGLSKKHLYAVRGPEPLPAPGSDLRLSDGRLAGQMRSSCGDIGLALVRDDLVQALCSDGPWALLTDGV